VGRESGYFFPTQKDLAGGWGVSARDGIKQAGFSCSVRANQTRYGFCFNGKADSVNSPDSAKMQMEIPYGKHCLSDNAKKRPGRISPGRLDSSGHWNQ